MSDAGYPSWLPRRPPPPAPQSTFHSTVDQQSPRAADIFGTTTGRKATPRSVRIVARDIPWREREPTGDSAATRVQENAFNRRSMSLSGPPTRPRPRFRAPSLHLALLRSPNLSMRIRYLLHPVFIFAHLVIQTYFDFNVVFVLLQISSHPGPTNNPKNWALAIAAYVACWIIQIIGIFLLYELIYSFWRRWRVKRPLILPIYLSSPAHSLVALTSFTHFCFFAYIRRSARPSLHTLIRPTSPAPPATIPQHLSSSPPLSGSPVATPPPPESVSQVSSDSSSSFFLHGFSDYIAEKCYWRVQNWPTVMTLLPRAAICLAVLLQTPPGPNAGRDSTYFDVGTGALSGYAKGILFANAAWTAWRFLVMLGGIIGLWILSGTACGGLCGPRYRWEEEPELEDDPNAEASPWEKRASMAYSDRLSPYPVSTAGYDADDVHMSDGWTWKRGTRTRVREAWEFCLTASPVSVISMGKARESIVVRDLPPPDTPTSPTRREYSTANVRARGSVPPLQDDAEPVVDEFAALEEVIRQSVLARGERYRRQGAGLPPTEGLSDIIPPKETLSREEAFGSQRSRRSDPLRVLPFPFPGSATSPRSAGSSAGAGTVPFPGEEEDQGEEEEGQEEEEEYEEEPSEEPVSPHIRRTSDSMSSLGRPVAYPFIGIGPETPQSDSRAQTSSGTGTQRTRSTTTGTQSSRTHTSSSMSGAGTGTGTSGTGTGSRSAHSHNSNFSSPGLTRSSQTHSTPSSHGGGVSSPAQTATHATPSSNLGSSPEYTRSTPSSHPASSPLQATPSSASYPRSPIPASFIPPPPPPPGPSGQRRRRRGTGPGLSADMAGVTFPVVNDQRVRMRTRTMSSGVRSDEPEPVAIYEGSDEEIEAAEEEERARVSYEAPGDSEEAEREDSVGLLSAAASVRGGVSPRPSLLSGLRARASSGALSGRSRSRGRKESVSGSSFGGSAQQEQRSRTQSLIQRVSEFGVISSGGRGRSRSTSGTGSGVSYGELSGDGREDAPGTGSGERSGTGSGGSRRESSGVESSSLSGGEGSHAPGVDGTFGRPGELRRQVEEARSRMALETHLEAPSISTSVTPSLRTAASELTARDVDMDTHIQTPAITLARSAANLSVMPSDGDLSTAHDSFVTAPMTIDSTTSGGTVDGRGGIDVSSAWTLRQDQDTWGFGQHGTH